MACFLLVQAKLVCSRGEDNHLHKNSRSARCIGISLVDARLTNKRREHFSLWSFEIKFWPSLSSVLIEMCTYDIVYLS